MFEVFKKVILYTGLAYGIAAALPAAAGVSIHCPLPSTIKLELAGRASTEVEGRYWQGYATSMPLNLAISGVWSHFIKSYVYVMPNENIITCIYSSDEPEIYVTLSSYVDTRKSFVVFQGANRPNSPECKATNIEACQFIDVSDISKPAE